MDSFVWGYMHAYILVIPASNDIPHGIQALSHMDFMLEDIMQVNGLWLRWLPDEFRDKKEVVLAAVMSSPEAYYYASQRLRDDNQVLSCQMPRPKAHVNTYQLIANHGITSIACIHSWHSCMEVYK